jgi:hypothetical protein
MSHLLVLWKCPENAFLSIVISVWEIERSPLEPNLTSRRHGEALLLVFLRENAQQYRWCHTGETIHLNCEIRDGHEELASVTVPLHLKKLAIHCLAFMNKFTVNPALSVEEDDEYCFHT